MQSDQLLLSKKIEKFIERNTSGLGVPIIDKQTNHIRIDNLTVILKKERFVVIRSFETLSDFSYKSWAVAFALAIAKRDREVANVIAQFQLKLDKLIEDSNGYRTRIDNATDITKKYILEDRLSRVKLELLMVNDDARHVIKSQGIV